MYLIYFDVIRILFVLFVNKISYIPRSGNTTLQHLLRGCFTGKLKRNEIFSHFPALTS